MSVGIIEFEAMLETVTSELEVRRVPHGSGDMWETYDVVGNELVIYCEGGRITGVGVFGGELWFNGINMMELTFDEVVDLLGEPDSIGEWFQGCRCTDFFKFEAQIWFKGDRVDSMMLSGELENPDDPA